MSLLSGKTAIITGASKGIGKGIVSGKIACEAEMTITIPEILDQFIPKK